MVIVSVSGAQGGADLHETREAPQKRPLDGLPDGATRR